MKEISIIIPVYNIEKYVSRCLDSCLSQSMENIEVIVVNDGSIDSSCQIISQYKKTYPNIVVIDQINRGLSAARNVGMQYATGKYIWFVDGDDYIDKESIEIILNYLRIENDIDVIVIGRFEEYKNKTIPVPHKVVFSRFKTGVEYFISSVDNETFRTNVWDKIIKRSLIEEHSLKFVEGLLYEDMFFVLQLFMFAGKVLVVPHYLYHYIHYNSNSITRQIREKDLDVLIFVEKAISFIDHNHFEVNRNCIEFQNLIFTWVSSCLLNKYVALSFVSKDAKIIVDTVIKNEYFRNSALYCSHDKKVSIRKIFFSRLLLLSPFIYRVALVVVLKIRFLLRTINFIV